MSEWVDVSVPLRDGMVHWPGDRPFSSSRDMELSAGEVCNLSSLSMSAHVGTHMDAPRHFLENGATMDQLPFDAVIGRARVIAIADPERIPISELERHAIQPGERILFKTANSSAEWSMRPFRERFVHIPAETGAYLAGLRPILIGIDYLSVGAFQGDGEETHRQLLSAGIWVIEGLNLTRIEPGDYEMICLPLSLAGFEGAPARALLRRIERG